MFKILSGAAAIQGVYTESARPIHINDLNCTGSEESVWECPHNGIEGYSCNHRQDASVVCQEGKLLLRRLTNTFNFQWLLSWLLPKRREGYLLPT